MRKILEGDKTVANVTRVLQEAIAVPRTPETVINLIHNLRGLNSTGLEEILNNITASSDPNNYSFVLFSDSIKSRLANMLGRDNNINGYNSIKTEVVVEKNEDSKEPSPNSTNTNINRDITPENSLDKLLKSEFDQIINDIEPINTIFDPNLEVSKIKKRRDLWYYFKQKLITQHKVWAKCHCFIKRKIEENNDVEKEELMEYIDMFAQKYGFTSSQIKKAENIIDAYYKNRENVKEFRIRFPNDVDLVNNLTDASFDKNIDIKVDTDLMSLNIYCDRSVMDKLYSKYNKKYTPIAYTMIDPKSNILYNVFIVDGSNKESLVHEQQHQENRLLKNELDSHYGEGKQLRLEYLNARNAEHKKKALQNYMKLERSKALLSVRNEILAMKADQKNYKYNIWFKEDLSPYDYLSSIRNIEDNILYNNYSKKILVDGYKKIIIAAIAAFDELIEIGGYSLRETIALLSYKELMYWPKTVNRLLSKRF